MLFILKLHSKTQPFNTTNQLERKDLLHLPKCPILFNCNAPFQVAVKPSTTPSYFLLFHHKITPYESHNNLPYKDRLHSPSLKTLVHNILSYLPREPCPRGVDKALSTSIMTLTSCLQQEHPATWLGPQWWADYLDFSSSSLKLTLALAESAHLHLLEEVLAVVQYFDPTSFLNKIHGKKDVWKKKMTTVTYSNRSYLFQNLERPIKSRSKFILCLKETVFLSIRV